MYIEQRYCNDCMIVHWVEITPTNREKCHGKNLRPAESPTHFTRRSGRGFELVERHISANVALANVERQPTR